MGMSSWWPEITLSPPAPSRFKIFHHYKRHCHQSGKCSYIRAEQRLFCFLLFIMVSVHLSQRIKCLKFLEMHKVNVYCQINIMQVQPSQIIFRLCCLVLANSQRMKQTRCTLYAPLLLEYCITSRLTSVRSQAMSFRKFACISLTRPGIIATWPK